MSFHEEEVLGKAYDARLMRRLLTYLRPHKWYVLSALLALIGDAVTQLAPPYLVKIAIDQYIAQGDLAGLNTIAFVYLAVLVAAFSLEYAQTYMMQMIGQRIMFDMRMLVGIFVTLLWMDWRLALIAFSVLPLIVVLAQWFRRNVRESYRKVRLRIARINAFLNEHINGMATVQLFRREEVNYGRFEFINREHRDANVEQILFYAVFLPAVEFVAAIATALILWYGGGFVMNGTLTLGSLVAFILYAGRFFRPISDMSEKFNTLQAAMASSERIFQLLDTEVAIKNPAHISVAQGFSPAPAKAHIVFENVSFAYKEDDYVLRDVSFEVKPGERVGIVGATGAGKSSLISLLLRFYDVTRGRILIDGLDIRDMDLAALRKMFSLVLQDVHLFSGTIAGNIRLGDESIDDARVRDAARAVHAHRFIESLPGGYDARVAERGATLSVGQKQLLSFARALAFDPSVLILDEATSSVDTETELLIRDALRVLMSGRTTLAIAHRLSTIQDMDKILVFHKGKLRESGSHQELLAVRGIYYKLFQLQYKAANLTAVPASASLPQETQT
jgi:ATP-binding cassette subfamily B multidrug efflux pump